MVSPMFGFCGKDKGFPIKKHNYFIILVFFINYFAIIFLHLK